MKTSPLKIQGAGRKESTQEMTGKVVAAALNPSLDRTVEVDGFAPYGLNRVVCSRTDPGGKGINAARVLRSFGADVTVAGFAAGKAGELLRGFLTRENIASELLEIPGETRTNLKVLDRKTGRVTEINESGCTVPPECLSQFEERFCSLCSGAEIVILSGSLPPGVPSGYYARLTAAAGRCGARVILDADGEALRQGVAKVPYAVKPNLEELRAFTGLPLDNPRGILAAGHKLTAAGVSLVAVSMGAQGAVFLDGRHAFRAVPWGISAGNATGAGDSMVGVLAYTLLHGEELAGIARLATAAGTVTASKPGTQLCTMEEVMEKLPLVSVSPLGP